MGYQIFHSQYTAAQIEAAIGKGPRVNASGYWEVWNVGTGAYESTGVGAGVTPPTVVTQVSQMTNHGYIYIYNGTETGYTAGYWYYWDGAAWTAGGAYQVAATDPTLSVAGAAADAKATGDAVDELKSALMEVDEWLGYSVNMLDGRNFTVSADNYIIVSSDSNSITIQHVSSFTTGAPECDITEKLEAGNQYSFHGIFSSTTYNYFVLSIDGTNSSLRNGDIITVPNSFTSIKLSYSPIATGTYSVSELSLRKVQESVKDSVDKIDDLASTYFQYAEGEETQGRLIGTNGAIITVSSTHYCIVKYTTVPNKDYIISGSSNFGNLIFAFYDSSNTVVMLGDASQGGATYTGIRNKKVTSPNRASYLLVAYSKESNYVATCQEEYGYTYKKWNRRKWVCIGDSLTERNKTTGINYYDYVSQKTGIDVVVMGVSGTGYARGQGNNSAFYQRALNCPTDADVITIFGSFNDLGAEIDLGNRDDNDTTTIAGCINQTITNLQSIIPLANIGIVSPTPWTATQPTSSGAAYNYVHMLQMICEHRSIPFLNLWTSSNLRPWESDFRAIAYTRDGGSGTHPDENGHKLIAPRFEWLLDSLLL